MKLYNVKITMPDNIEDGKALHNDLQKYNGFGSVQYQTWQRLYEADNTHYHGGFDIIFSFHDKQNAHEFNNIWDEESTDEI